MVLRLLSRLPARQLDSFVSALKPDGLVQLVNLLLAERDFLRRFELVYPTPELRRLAAKAERSGITEQGQAALNASKKVFVGRLTNGEQIKDERAIEVVNQIINIQKLRGDFVDRLSNMTEGGKLSDMMFLGERLSTINVNPKRFSELVYRDLFTQPKLVMDALSEIIKLRADTETLHVFEDRDALEKELRKLGIFEVEDNESVSMILSICVDASKDISSIRQVIMNLLNEARKLDIEFKMDVYNSLKKVMPQYNGVNVKWTVWFISSFIGPYKPYLSPWVSMETLLAFYRKGVELTC